MRISEQQQAISNANLANQTDYIWGDYTIQFPTAAKDRAMVGNKPE